MRSALLNFSFKEIWLQIISVPRNLRIRYFEFSKCQKHCTLKNISLSLMNFDSFYLRNQLPPQDKNLQEFIPHYNIWHTIYLKNRGTGRMFVSLFKNCCIIYKRWPREILDSIYSLCLTCVFTSFLPFFIFFPLSTNFLFYSSVHPFG